MASGSREHRKVEGAVAEQLASGGSSALIRSSAGALVEALQALDARRGALVTPYPRSLAQKVVHYLEEKSFTITDWRALEVADNAEAGCNPAKQVMEAARSLKLTGVDALVISGCVQMPSLPLVEAAEEEVRHTSPLRELPQAPTASCAGCDCRSRFRRRKACCAPTRSSCRPEP